MSQQAEMKGTKFSRKFRNLLVILIDGCLKSFRRGSSKINIREFRVIPFFNHTPNMEEYVVKTFPSHFLFHLDHTDLLMEEHISTRDPSDFQEIQSICKIFFQPPWSFTSIFT